MTPKEPNEKARKHLALMSWLYWSCRSFNNRSATCCHMLPTSCHMEPKQPHGTAHLQLHSPHAEEGNCEQNPNILREGRGCGFVTESQTSWGWYRSLVPSDSPLFQAATPRAGCPVPDHIQVSFADLSGGDSTTPPLGNPCQCLHFI